jgi:beta-phosphoglucomutase-like phosphatase (HAD superfamily)
LQRPERHVNESRTPPFAALDDILTKPRHLRIDFDGPICSLFAGTPTAPVADHLRKVITTADVPVPLAIENTTDWFAILAYAAEIGPDLAASVESELSALEYSAVATAEPTPYVRDVLTACFESGRSAAVISNNSMAAVRAYLSARDLGHQVHAVAARTTPDVTVLKPSPHLIYQAAEALGADRAACAVVGDSPSDIEAAHSAGAKSIGYAKAPHDAERLVDANAGAIITSMANLALRLRAR